MDSSTYDSLISLVQRGFVTGQGNWGRYGLDDSRAAAYRYTECKANNDLNDIFSDYLKFVPWEELELEAEPLYIPFPVPLGLIGNGVTTGIGFNTTKIPRYSFVDLVKRLVSLIEKDPNIKTIIPSITNCTINEDSPGEFEKLLTTGNGRLKITPFTIVNNTEILIHGRNPLIGFTALKKINERHEEEHGYQLFNAIDLWDYKCKYSIYIQVTSSKKSKLLSSQFKKTILDAITTTTNFKVNVIDSNNNKVVLKSIDQLLLENYEKWKNVNLKFYKNQLDVNIIKLEELNIIKAVRDILKNNPGVKTIDEIIKLNTSNYSDSDIRSVCTKHSIKTLIEAHIDVNTIQNRINSLNKTIADIDNVVINELKHKYLKK